MKLFTILFILLFITSCAMADPIITFQDAKDDDKGGGNLRYPLADIFVPNAFDLKKLTVKDEGKYYEFEIELWGKIITAPYGSRAQDFSFRGGNGGVSDQRFGVGPNGWIYQMIDIYINFGMNRHELALPGRNIRFFPRHKWDKVILITPENSVELKNFIQNNHETPGLRQMSDDIVLPHYYRVRRNTFRARVYKNRLPEFTGKIGFQLFIMGYSSSFDRPSTLKTIPVEANATYRTFGGEFSYCEGQPFIVDMLCPAGENQYRLLKNYSCSKDPGRKLFAKVPLVWIELD